MMSGEEGGEKKSGRVGFVAGFRRGTRFARRWFEVAERSSKC